MLKNQPGKSVKTKRNKEIHYFANIISCLVTQKLLESVKLMAHSTNFHSPPFNTARTESLKNPFRQANRRPKDKYI